MTVTTGKMTMSREGGEEILRRPLIVHEGSSSL